MLVCEIQAPYHLQCHKHRPPVTWIMTVLVIRPVGFLIAGLILCLGKVSHSGLKLLRSGSELELTNLKLENELAAEKEAYTCTRAHTIDSLQGGLPQLLQAVIALSDVEDEVYDRLISTLQMLHLQVIYPPPSCWLGFYYLLVTK